ncbi:M20 metallopeptidase family protein [Geosporobacter ferrireducens]|uniref:N-acyl-L-amino acid amidohydrolase n=1 Tax=Geosporobacter ferrireducens TaxID=1424294 RepID=A0A1D8GKP2_9FIRM|nr:amidohydrolase [Geosporobacter ferrireducens]AOT71488.1 N-acyl-L-amino acid amidohydrolase [Geosporobacter ferrireducens]MTI57798.1 amidohydrolase [Geosporobacter ferrireducens]
MHTERIIELSKKYYDEMVELRHQFHMYPEIGFEEKRTSETIVKVLKKLGIEFTANVAKTGVVGIIKGKCPGKTVLLRADMDALVLQEEANVPYKSRIPGRMHACGHDGHTAGLLGAAMILNELKDELKGNIKLVFQPAEENDGGAKPMIEEGILENPTVDAAFGCHLWGGTQEGHIHVKHGAVMAAPDKFTFRIIGKGGHGAMPHLAVDSISIAVQAINNMQTIVSRRINPLTPVVISFCSIHGGESHNILPNEVEVVGTVRIFDEDLRQWIPKAMEEILEGVTKSQGANYTFEYIERFPPLINDYQMTDLVSKAVGKIVGDERVSEAPEPNMGGEDFAYFCQKVPASFFFVGISKDLKNPVCHHHPEFQWDDKNLLTVAQSMAQVAVDFLCEDKQ